MHTSTKRKALKAIALSFATAAVFTGSAFGQPAPEIPYLSHGQGVDETSFSGLPNQSTRSGGPVFMNGTPDGYVGSGIESAPGGVTPANLARAYEPRFEGVARPDGYQPQLRGDEPLVIRDAPDGLVPKTTPSDVVSVSATSDGFDRGDVVIGVGLGLILATACAIALAAAAGGRMRTAHS